MGNLHAHPLAIAFAGTQLVLPELSHSSLALRVDTLESILEAILEATLEVTLEDTLELEATLEAILVAILVADPQHNP